MMNVSKLFVSLEKIKVCYAKVCSDLLEEYNLPKTSFDIIMFLYNNPEAKTAKEISEERNIKKNVVSLHVDRLVNEGYLKRNNIEGDRRKIHLVLTSKALEIAKKGRVIQNNFANEITSGISKEDIQKFKSVFDNVIENAVKMGEKIERI